MAAPRRGPPPTRTRVAAAVGARDPVRAAGHPHRPPGHGGPGPAGAGGAGRGGHRGADAGRGGGRPRRHRRPRGAARGAGRRRRRGGAGARRRRHVPAGGRAGPPVPGHPGRGQPGPGRVPGRDRAGGAAGHGPAHRAADVPGGGAADPRRPGHPGRRAGRGRLGAERGVGGEDQAGADARGDPRDRRPAADQLRLRRGGLRHPDRLDRVRVLLRRTGGLAGGAGAAGGADLGARAVRPAAGDLAGLDRDHHRGRQRARRHPRLRRPAHVAGAGRGPGRGAPRRRAGADRPDAPAAVHRPAGGEVRPAGATASAPAGPDGRLRLLPRAGRDPHPGPRRHRGRRPWSSARG